MIILHPECRRTSLLFLLAALLSGPLVWADDITEAKRKQLVEALFEADSDQVFQKALSQAVSAGLPEQTLLEARFLNLINEQDNKGIAALAPEMRARKDSFNLAESVIFSVPEEWQAIVHYCEALAALEGGNQAKFKKHIQEAFWLSPRQAGIFASHIERLRLEEAMRKIELDLNKPYHRQHNSEEVSLGGLAENSPVILLHFWSPWSRECEESLEDFIVTSKELSKKQVVVISVLADSDPEALPDANSYRETVNKKTEGIWILDDQNAPLLQQLRIPDLPTMVLVDRAGKILFNGHPSEEQLWEELKKIVPGVDRPPLEKK